MLAVTKKTSVCLSSCLGAVSPRLNGKRDTWSVPTVSSMKLSAQEMVATAHVTLVATYFHYCRKVTLCLNGKLPNYNFIAPTKCIADPPKKHKFKSFTGFKQKNKIT